ncbi:uncharacterized protein PgNI_07629 [Pyricularia grisea]|uniref:Peroxin/Ferlin domain-containing protein n=1 Tax=Pyricularia grisea TaxID=148305 RepID=A0A6P8B1W2_PYRGI|nr:uncharacterized protein PgNI_07629 [Pyricularia grisea]TLD08708.1 hypothetical protein PgNI_07629 [Pyricularia grisea]
MTKPRIRKPRTSRRAAGLRDSDYDHEITLVSDDDTAPNDPKNTTNSSGTKHSNETTPRGESFESGVGPSERVPTTEPLVGKQHSGSQTSSSSSSRRRSGQSNTSRVSKLPITESNSSANVAKEPAIHVQQPTPFERPGPDAPQPERSSITRAVDTEAIDTLYENERGALCCGIPLFASKALGNLDPPPWTNVAHKPSPTNIHTAQVPDPSWTWAWPEWRVNHEEGTDKDGWEYSFAFYRKFSWHGPKWWNSFVRRRAWIRRRVKKEVMRDANGGELLQPDYFTVRSTHEAAVAAAAKDVESRPSSKRESIISHASVASRTAALATEIATVGGVSNLEIRDVDTLLAVLRVCRIDREKIEAVEKFLSNGGDDDLDRLDEKMHDIMAFFVFQASRRALVARLAELRDRAAEESAKNKTGKDKEAGNDEGDKVASLDAALKHADEEVRKLEYWSDIKGLAEKGQSRDAMDGQCGWDHSSWEGVDNSGPAAPGERPQK